MTVEIRRAELRDLFNIYRLLSDVSLADDSLLHRSSSDIKRYLATFWIAVSKEEVIGCVSCHPYSKKLCEIRSHAVAAQYRGSGVGVQLLETAIQGARTQFSLVWMDVKKDRFLVNNYGFRRISRSKMPIAVLLKKLKWVFSQSRNRWLPSLVGRFTLIELRLA